MLERNVKLFGMSNQMLERDLDVVEQTHQVDLGRRSEPKADRDEAFYPQFEKAIRQEAEAMASHYEMFYCLERSIRAVVVETLEEKHGAKWWAEAVPENVQKDASENMQRELDQAVTRRSMEEIDYTTFGQLGEIVRANWEDFSDLFKSRKGFDKVMTSLNVLRGPIAHCCPLAEDEALRLRLTLKDWFRLMG